MNHPITFCVRHCVLAVLLLVVADQASAQSLPIVPGIVGSGTTTRAAYGAGTEPAIYRVTTLNDRGIGSLRAALEASGPRVVIFEISGTIVLDTDIVILNPFITVAGQTAPSPGIAIVNYGLGIDTHDVLLQHLRIRPGWGGNNCNSALLVWSYGGEAYNIVLDHLSTGWGQDENIGVSNPARPLDMTIWRSIIAEGLVRAQGSDHCTGGGQSAGHGLLVFADAQNVSVIQNLFAKNFERNPYMQGNTRTVIINNLIYQWHGPWGIVFANYGATGGNWNHLPWFASVVGNRFVKGPYTTEYNSTASMFLYSGAAGASTWGNEIFRLDNTLANQDGTVAEEFNAFPYDPNVSSPPLAAPLPPGFTPLASTEVEGFVLANAGARPWDRDSTDARIVNEVVFRTGGFISNQIDVGGFSTLATRSRVLTPPANPHADADGDGYTNLEEWLHGFAVDVAITVSGVSTAPSETSSDGTRVPPAPAIIDDSAAAWTLGSSGEILRDGVHAAGGYASRLLWSANTLYALGGDSLWQWTGTYWLFVRPADPSEL